MMHQKYQANQHSIVGCEDRDAWWIQNLQSQLVILGFLHFLLDNPCTIHQSHLKKCQGELADIVKHQIYFKLVANNII
jgi:hypothetical protein